MKKFLSCLSLLVILSHSAVAQDEFDRKFRFGLRITPQPTWFVSDDKNNIPSGAAFGFGFGLNMEFRFSDVAGFLTGIGGDFEGGRYTFKYDPANNYVASYWMNEASEFVAPKVENKTANTVYILNERKISTTYASIPLILKLSTKEYSGLKYFGQFGGEIGIRVKATAADTYYETRKYSTETSYTVTNGPSTEEDINIVDETSLIPMRLGMNVGLGAEYRLGGSTSAFASVNFFRAFTNLMSKESDYTYYRTNDPGPNETYRFVEQSLKLTAIRINIGIMF